MLKKLHIKIKKCIFRKHFQKKDKLFLKECELYNNFFHVKDRTFSLYFSYSQGTDTKAEPQDKSFKKFYQKHN